MKFGIFSDCHEHFILRKCMLKPVEKTPVHQDLNSVA